MKTSENVDKILPRLFKVKTDLKSVAKTSNNPYFKSKYADLNSHLDAVEDLLHNNGLILFQPTTGDATGNYVTTRIADSESGQYVEATVKLVGEADMQKVGSAITYARRYTLGSLLSMKAEDDDGNFASGKTSNKVTAKPAIQVTLGSPAQAGGTTTEVTEQPKAAKTGFRDRLKNKVTTSDTNSTATTSTVAVVNETSSSDDL